MIDAIDVQRWDDLIVDAPAAGGHRNEVYRGTCNGQLVSIRRTRRSPDSLQWELELIGHLGANGLRVAQVVPTTDGSLSAGGWVVQRWLEGDEPTTPAQWTAVADVLRWVHRVTRGYPQRADCCVVRDLATVRRCADADLDQVPAEVHDTVIAVFESFDDVPTAVIHGDPAPSNIRVDRDGRVGLLDFDESRVDLIWHDLSNLGVQVLADADHARAQRLSHAWEAVNGWVVEPDYARGRYEQLLALL